MVYQPNAELKILVNGRAIDEYLHDDKFYVEGRRGSNYEIWYKNNTGTRQRVVLSVDGQNVMTGDATWERAYCVDPWQILCVPGWRKDANNVAKFFFSSVRDSYNQHNPTGQAQARNIGVIGCRVFNEKAKQWSYTLPTYHYHYHYPSQPVYGPFYSTSWGNVSSGTFTGASGGGNVGGGGGSFTNSIYTFNMAGGGDGHLGVACGGIGASFGGVASTPIMDCFMTQLEEQSVSANVGTGWGANQEFKTTDVYYDFEKNSCAELLIFYDDAKGLERRGINIRRPTPTVFPDAFPSDGCPPPR